MVSEPVPPISDSTFETEPVLSKLPSVRLSLPPARSMLLELVSSAESVTEVRAGAAGHAFDVGDRDRVRAGSERQRIGAVAEVDEALRDGLAER